MFSKEWQEGGISLSVKKIKTQCAAVYGDFLFFPEALYRLHGDAEKLHLAEEVGQSFLHEFPAPVFHDDVAGIFRDKITHAASGEHYALPGKLVIGAYYSVGVDLQHL